VPGLLPLALVLGGQAGDLDGVDGRTARAFDVRGLPALTLIDRKGKIRFYNIAGRDFRNAVAKLLQEK